MYIVTELIRGGEFLQARRQRPRTLAEQPRRPAAKPRPADPPSSLALPPTPQLQAVSQLGNYTEKDARVAFQQARRRPSGPSPAASPLFPHDPSKPRAPPPPPSCRADAAPLPLT